MIGRTLDALSKFSLNNPSFQVFQAFFLQRSAEASAFRCVQQQTLCFALLPGLKLHVNDVPHQLIPFLLGQAKQIALSRLEYLYEVATQFF